MNSRPLPFVAHRRSAAAVSDTHRGASRRIQTFA
jgi:hypothetical protein